MLCDVDGVLRLWDADAMSTVDREFGLVGGTLAGAAFREARLGPAIVGQVTDAGWRSGVAEDLAEVCGSVERAGEVVAAWTLISGEVDQAVKEILSGLRGKVPVGLVSNATTRLEDDLRALGVMDAVDFVVSSARVGVAKPDAGIYLAAAREAGVPPQECLFIDDTEANIVGARAVGMTGVHYRRIADLTAVGLW